MYMWAVVLINLIVFGALLAVMAILAWAFVNIFGRDRKRQSGSEFEDESRMIQEIYQGFVKMEARVETLETLLLERDRERKQ